jgi:hypothetical protein
LVGGGYAAATPVGVRALTPFGRRVRRPWVEVDRVAWDDDSRTLAIWWVGSRRALGLELAGGSFLPEVVHERLRSSMLVTRDVALPGDRTAKLTLRRDADGVVTCQVDLPPGVRAGDPKVQAVVRAAERRLHEEAGV